MARRQPVKATHKGTKWTETSRAFREAQPFPWICARCGERIDPYLHHNDRMAVTVGHVVPLAVLKPGDSRAYDWNYLRLEHRACNSAAAARGYDTPPTPTVRPLPEYEGPGNGKAFVLSSVSHEEAERLRAEGWTPISRNW